MEIVPIKIVHGENKSWDMIAAMNPEDACARTLARFDPASGEYTMRCFGTDFTVMVRERLISCDTPMCDLMLVKLKDFFRLSVLWYFTSAMNIPASGKLLKPLDVKGGQRFFAGTHMLPLDAIAQKYATDPQGFIEHAQRFGAEVVGGFGDACVRLYPLPRVPITMVLWIEDEEFPPRVDLFFDSTINYQISLSDIVWSIAVMSCLIFVDDQLSAAR